jgi:hypothetical protein
MRCAHFQGEISIAFPIGLPPFRVGWTPTALTATTASGEGGRYDGGFRLEVQVRHDLPTDRT